MFIEPLYAAAETAPPQPGIGSMLFPFVIIFIVFYFIVIRPQRQQQKKLDEMRNQLQKGDQVVTIGGIVGTVDLVRDDLVTLKVNDNTKIKFRKSAISHTIKEGEKNEKRTDGAK